MATATPSMLIDAIRASGLLEADQLERIAEFQADEPDVKTLATRIVRANLLTLYQVQQLLKGRGKQLILGNYVLLERIGEGGMGQVFKARHRKLNRLAAVKIIRPDLLAQANTLARFQREARAAAQLAHPNIVAIYDADQEGDTHYLAMEYVDGTDLAQMLAQRGPLPAAEACEFIRQTAIGLQHAHSRGLVHRDIKPHNLLVTKDPAEGSVQHGLARSYGFVKILDMGLARALAPDARELGAITHEGVVVGTLDYLAPEQARDARAADHRSDLYSLGCTFYHLLTGKPPFSDGDGVGKLLKHQMDDPPPVEKVRSDIPPAMLAVLNRLMAKKPEDRYQTAGDAGNALTACLTGAPLTETPIFAAVPVLIVVLANRKTAGDEEGTPAERRDPLLQYLPENTVGVVRVEFAELAAHPWVKKNLGAALQKLSPPAGRPGKEPPLLDLVDRFAVLVGAQGPGSEVFIADVRPEFEQFIRGNIAPREMPDGHGGKYRLYSFPAEPRNAGLANVVFLDDHRLAGSAQWQFLLQILAQQSGYEAPAQRLAGLRAQIAQRDPADVVWFAIHSDVLTQVPDPAEQAVKKDLDVIRREVQLVHGGVRAGKDMQIQLTIETRTAEGAREVARMVQKYLGLAQFLVANADVAPVQALLPLLEAGEVSVVGSAVHFKSQMSFDKLDEQLEKLRKE